MSTAISLRGLTKVYATGVTAVSGLDLSVDAAEFVVLVGPSGCGKTTALRLVAGLETIKSRSVAFGDRVVNGVSPRHRDVAMVFQNYALCPHLTVYQNIGSQRLPVPSGSGPAGYQGRKIIIGIRPEDLGDPASEPEAGDPALCVDVRLVEVLGSEQHVYFAIDATPLGSGAGADLAAITTNGVARAASGAGNPAR